MGCKWLITKWNWAEKEIKEGGFRVLHHCYRPQLALVADLTPSSPLLHSVPNFFFSLSGVLFDVITRCYSIQMKRILIRWSWSLRSFTSLDSSSDVCHALFICGGQKFQSQHMDPRHLRWEVNGHCHIGPLLRVVPTFLTLSYNLTELPL